MNITPDLVRAARESIGLTPAQAAGLLDVSIAQWQDWEYGAARMPFGLYELFLAKTGRSHKPKARKRQFWR